MQINIKNLNECPVLSANERELLRRVHVEGETQSAVAKSLQKSPSTISLQVKKALAKFLEWKKKQESPAEANLDKYVFDRLNLGDTPWVIIADMGHADEVIAVSEKWRGLHADDYWSAWAFLGNYVLTSGFDDEEEPLTKAVEVTVDWLSEAYDELEESEQESRNLCQKLENETDNLKAVTNELNLAQEEIRWLERFKKYEGFSFEMKQALQGEIALLRGIIEDLKLKIEGLKTEKRSMEIRVGKLKQVGTEIQTNIQSSAMQYIGSLQLDDVLKIYTRAIMHRHGLSI